LDLVTVITGWRLIVFCRVNTILEQITDLTMYTTYNVPMRKGFISIFQSSRIIKILGNQLELQLVWEIELESAILCNQVIKIRIYCTLIG